MLPASNSSLQVQEEGRERGEATPLPQRHAALQQALLVERSLLQVKTEVLLRYWTDNFQKAFTLKRKQMQKS